MGKTKYFLYVPTGVKCSRKIHIAPVTKQKHQKNGKITHRCTRIADGHRKNPMCGTSTFKKFHH